MASCLSTELPDRGIIAIHGPDSRDFLQGLISNDIALVSSDRSIYAALLTPQGKYLFDFFVSQYQDRLLIDCEKERLPELTKRLRMYKLRADATISDESATFAACAIWGENPGASLDLDQTAGRAQEHPDGTISVDPRLGDAGLRVVGKPEWLEEVRLRLKAEPASPDDYDMHRLTLGLPDSSRDLIVDKSILLESGFDDLNGINWDKGCYMGQELTARTKYRGLVKKRLIPVTIDGAAPEPGALIMNGEKTAGEMRSSKGNQGLALLRLEHLNDPSATLTANDSVVQVVRPEWARF